MGLREQYAIKEFANARQALDGYYGAINALAHKIKARVEPEDVREAVENSKDARRRLKRAIEALGFVCTDSEDKEQQA